ncbi:MAG TPA: beta-propeller fold lactonase family protein, partial [Edaphobacter sp.]|nr:beta-propeller fold lactonase family protein [Edaphobacter sp.]
STSSQHFSVIGTYTDHTTADLSSSATWNVSNPWVTNISGIGAASALRAGFSTVTASIGNLSSSAGLTVTATPRYLYVGSEGGDRNLTRMAVNAATGQPSFLGYQSTGSGNTFVSCITVDPTEQHAYLPGLVIDPSSQAAHTDLYIFGVDAVTGKVTANSATPLHLSMPIGCIQFTPSGKFAYAVTGKGLLSTSPAPSNQLVTFSVQPDATIIPLNTITLPHGVALNLAIDPLGKFLYVVADDLAEDTSYIYGYTIDSMGNLAQIDGTPFQLRSGQTPSFHPSGNFIYFSSINNTSISEYSVDRTTGKLSLASVSSTTYVGASALLFSPDGTHAYLTYNGSNFPLSSLATFTVSASGQLNQIGSTSAGMTPKQMIVDPSGKFLYLLGSGNDYAPAGPAVYDVAGNTMMVYKIGSDGTPSLINQIAGRVGEDNFILLSGVTPIVWVPTTAYVTSSGDNKLTSYAVKSNGRLTLLQSATTLSSPSFLTMLPWGSDLLLTSQSTKPNLAAYSLSNGHFASNSIFGIAAQPGNLVIDPSGLFAFQADAITRNTYEYVRSSSTNPWTTSLDSNLRPVAYPTGGGLVTTDPSGRYLVAANQSGANISLIQYAGAIPTPPTPLSFSPTAITVDPSGNFFLTAGDDLKLHVLLSNGLGQLTDISNQNLPSISNSIAVDPTGHFIYAAGVAGLSAFSLNLQSGMLTPLSLNLPVSLANATGVYIDPSGQFLYVSVSSNIINALYLFNINTDGTLTSTDATPVAFPNHATSMTFGAQIQ